MTYNVLISNQFKKDFKRCMKRGLNMQLVTEAMDIPAEEGSLPLRYQPHKLKADKRGLWECHIQPDWLMTWEQDDRQLTLLFLQTGTHSDLF